MSICQPEQTPSRGAYPYVPTLVLHGDLDTTTASGAREVARRFPGATLVEVANSVHGELRIAWEKRPQATATLEGAIGGRELRATMPAP